MPVNRKAVGAGEGKPTRGRTGPKPRKDVFAEVEDGEADDVLLRGDARRLKAYAEDWEKYCLEQVKIIDKDGEEKPFVWNRPQRRLAGRILARLASGEPALFVILKARQWGCSTLIASLFRWLTDTKDNMRVYVLTLDDDSTDNLREMYDQMYGSMEEEVRHGKVKSARKYGEVLANGSGWRVRTAGTKATAGKVGRSKTMQGLHITEEAFWEAGRKTLLGALNTVKIGPGKVIARESTPNGASGTFYDAYIAAKNGESQYEAFFVPWFEIEWYEDPVSEQELMWWYAWREEVDDDARRMLGVVDDTDGRIERYGLSPGQYKWWSNKLLNACEGDVEQMRQEYPDDDVSCFMRTGGPVFRDEHLLWLTDYLREPKRYSLVRGENNGIAAYEQTGAPYAIWEMPDPSADYLLVCDSALGPASRDWTVAYVIKRKEGMLEQVARLRGKYEPNETADMLVLLYQFYGGPLTAPEVNPAGGGMTILEVIRKARVSRIYRRLSYDVASKQWTRDQLGWYTNSITRPMMIAAGQKMLRKNEATGRGMFIVRCKVLFAELQTFVKSDKTDKIAAAPGKSDDAVMAFLIGCRVEEDYRDVMVSDRRIAVAMGEDAAAKRIRQGDMQQERATVDFGRDVAVPSKAANPAQDFLLAMGFYE